MPRKLEIYGRGLVIPRSGKNLCSVLSTSAAFPLGVVCSRHLYPHHIFSQACCPEISIFVWVVTGRNAMGMPLIPTPYLLSRKSRRTGIGVSEQRKPSRLSESNYVLNFIHRKRHSSTYKITTTMCPRFR